jgi:hypothetical protein
LNAAITLRALSLRADQRTHAIGLVADGIEGIEARQLGIELGLGILIEKIERLARAVVPMAVDIPRVAADTLKWACSSRVMSA